MVGRRTGHTPHVARHPAKRGARRLPFGPRLLEPRPLQGDHPDHAPGDQDRRALEQELPAPVDEHQRADQDSGRGQGILPEIGAAKGNPAPPQPGQKNQHSRGAVFDRELQQVVVGIYPERTAFRVQRLQLRMPVLVERKQEPEAACTDPAHPRLPKHLARGNRRLRSRFHRRVPLGHRLLDLRPGEPRIQRGQSRLQKEAEDGDHAKSHERLPILFRQIYLGRKSYRHTFKQF